MDIVGIRASKRDSLGKGSVRKIRTGGKIPAILYGPGIDNIPIEVEAKEFAAVTHGSSSTILRLELEGEKDHPAAIVKEVQRDPLKRQPIHVDFMKIAMDERITAMVPVTLVGEAPGVKEGGVLQHGLRELQVEALARDLPDHVEVSIGDMDVGDTMRVVDLPDYPALTVLNDSEEVVCTLVPPTIIREEEVAVAEEELAEEEPELVGKEEAEGEEEEESSEESQS